MTSMYTKDPPATLDYSVDWTSFLADGETITSVDWTVLPDETDGLVTGDEISSGNTRGIFVSGGVAGNSYQVRCEMTTSQGRTDSRAITIRINGGVNEPLLLADVKDHLRIDHSEEDAYLTGLIMAARDAVEMKLDMYLITRTYDQYLHAWPFSDRLGYGWWNGVCAGAYSGLVAMSAVRLKARPVSEITSVEVDTGNGYQAISTDSYVLQQSGIDFPRLVKTSGASYWPKPAVAANGIRIRMQAGYGDSWNAVPPAIRQALLRIVAHLYRNRGDDAAQAVQKSGAAMLLAPFRPVRL